jgi:hypothetical protein
VDVRDPDERNRRKKLTLAAAIAAGKLCERCGSGDRCVDPPTESLPLDLQCPGCGGRGCEACVGGQIQIAGCPRKVCGEQAFALLRLARWADRGILPWSGSLADQDQGCLEALDFASAQLRHFSQGQGSGQGEI